MRGNSERTGGEQAARAMFRQLTGRDPAGSFDRVVLDMKEVVYRTHSKSGVPKIEIVDHTQKIFDSTIQLWAKFREVMSASSEHHS